MSTGGLFIGHNRDLGVVMCAEEFIANPIPIRARNWNL